MLHYQHWRNGKLEHPNPPPDPKRDCDVQGCDRPHNSFGYCSTHARRFKKGMDVNSPIQSRTKQGAQCAFPDCGAKPAAHGLCNAHFNQKSRGQELKPRRAYIQGDVKARLAHYAPPLGADDCWLWTGGLARGHGTIWHDGKQRGAHCVSWELANDQKVPPNMVVRHKCDVGHCVNPNHLEIGTQEQNIMDMVERGRYVATSGYKHRTSREKAQIRELYKEGVPQFKLAKIFGCSHQTIARIIKDLKPALEDSSI